MEEGVTWECLHLNLRIFFFFFNIEKKKACPACVGMTTPGLVHDITAYLSFTSKAVVVRQTHEMTGMRSQFKKNTYEQSLVV